MLRISLFNWLVDGFVEFFGIWICGMLANKSEESVEFVGNLFSFVFNWVFSCGILFSINFSLFSISVLFDVSKSFSFLEKYSLISFISFFLLLVFKGLILSLSSLILLVLLFKLFLFPKSTLSLGNLFFSKFKK